MQPIETLWQAGKTADKRPLNRAALASIHGSAYESKRDYMTTVEQVKEELAEMRRVGMPVTDKHLTYVDRRAQAIEQYAKEDHMTISDIADLVLALV